MDAAASLFWLRDNLTSERGAEARFLLAEIKFRDGDMDGALTEIENLLKMRPAYNYWIAKGIMLRSKVYMAQDNLFQAEQDLKSIIQQYFGLVVLTLMNYLLSALIFGLVLPINSMRMQAGAGL